MLAEIAKATGIRLNYSRVPCWSARMRLGGRPKKSCLLPLWRGQKWSNGSAKEVGEEISLAGVPHLMTTSEAHAFLFDPEQIWQIGARRFQADFPQVAKRGIPDYERSAGRAGRRVAAEKDCGRRVAELSIEKRGKAFSKKFTVGLGVGLTSPRFAPTQDRRFRLPVSLFRLFGIWPLPMQWTYHTEADLHEALKEQRNCCIWCCRFSNRKLP